MSELMEYLENIIESSTRPITCSGDVTNIMNKWLVKAQEANHYEANNIEPFLKPEGRILQKHELEFLPQEELESNWRFFCADDVNRYLYQWCTIQRDIVLDKDKYVYALSSVYCQEEHETMVFCASLTPISIWINGELVYTSNYDFFVKETTFVYNFKKGSNSVLIEKPYFLRHESLRINPDDFIITLKPYEFCANKKENFFFDLELFEKLKHIDTILLNKAVYEENDSIEVVVLPRYFKETMQRKDIMIYAYDDRGQVLASVKSKTTTRVSLNIAPDYRGIVKISASIVGEDSFILDNYLIISNLTEFANQCFTQASKRKDCNQDILYSLRKLITIPNTKLGTMENFYCMMNTYVYHLIFEKLYEFKQYLQKPEMGRTAKPFDIFKYVATVFYKNGIDDNNLIAYVVLPKEYDSTKKYPVVINFEHGYAAEYPILREYHRFQDFDDTILVDLCGRGGLNKDYINECNVLEIIEDVVQTYNIDRDRIYTTGACTGAMKSFGLAIKNPGLFAGVYGLNGPIRTNVENPDFELLKNLETVTINEVYCIEDADFNCSTIVNTFEHVKNAKLWPVTTYAHEDFNEALNSNLIVREMLKIRKNKYPKKFEFTMLEPIYNHCHFIIVDHILDLTKRAHVKVVLVSKECIKIDSTNIDKLSVLFNKDEMNLESMITIEVDGQPLQATLSDYEQVMIAWGQTGLTLESIPLTKEEYLKRFNVITVDEEQMGLKQLYYKKCKIIYSNAFKKTKNAMINRLIRVVNKPLVERVKNYDYKKYAEADVEKSQLKGCNFIYLADLNDTNELQQLVFESANCKAAKERIEYQGITFEGDTFAIIKCKNPFNESKHTMLVVYNSDTVIKELLDVWGTFDDNTLFYGDAIIYNKEQYYSYRDNNA